MIDGTAAVLTMHPTLLIGPADWDSERMPQAEFAARIARLWQEFPAAAGAIVYGSSSDHAALAYLTNFTPKLEPGIALIPRNGEPRLMVGGGANMLPAAKPLTWITDLVSLRPTGKTVAQWLETIGGSCVCVGCDNMPTRMHQELAAALAGRDSEDGTAKLAALMRYRSARELGCVREACVTLTAAVAAMAEAKRAGHGVTAVVLAGEHAAIRRGAQDVRTLFSLDGGKTMRPFDLPIEAKVDPLPIYLAVRQFGYWADGFVRLTGKPDGAMTGARETLQRCVAAARPGAAIAPPAQANSIGLALDEGPATTFEAGGIYTLRVSLKNAAASAMVATGDSASDVLWSSP